MSITRRHLVAAGALALGGVGLWRSSSAVAESADEAAVAQAVEALRKAIFGAGRRPHWRRCAPKQLSYGHSDGRVENKAQFINGVMTRKATVKSLTFSDHTIAIVGTDAIARHTWASESETDGKTTSTKIGVLQVWLRSKAEPGNCWPVKSVRTPPATYSRPSPASVTPHSARKKGAASPSGTPFTRLRLRRLKACSSGYMAGRSRSGPVWPKPETERWIYEAALAASWRLRPALPACGSLQI